jgi:hypothetical protein
VSGAVIGGTARWKIGAMASHCGGRNAAGRGVCTRGSSLFIGTLDRGGGSAWHRHGGHWVRCALVGASDERLGVGGRPQKARRSGAALSGRARCGAVENCAGAHAWCACWAER